MASVMDIARYLLERLGPVDAFKLHKLVFYSHAYSIVWNRRELFGEPVKAWENGPVVPVLFGTHKGLIVVPPSQVPGDASRLESWARHAVDDTLSRFGAKSSEWLVAQTHREQPWLDARAAGERTGEKSPRITTEAIRAFYSSVRFFEPDDLDATFERFIESPKTREAERLGRESLKSEPAIPFDSIE